MSRPLLAILALVLAIVTVTGISRIQLQTDILSLLPPETRGLEQMTRLRDNLSNEREVTLLVETSDVFTPEDLESLQSLTQQLGDLAGTERARLIQPSLATEEEKENFITLVSYLWLNQPTEEFENFKSLQLSERALNASAEDALDVISSSVDAAELFQASNDPFRLTDHPFIAWQSQTARELTAASETALVILLTAEQDLTDFASRAEWISEIKETVAVSEANHWHTSLSGSPVFSAELGNTLKKDFTGTTGIAALLVVALFYFFQRSLRQLLAVAVCLALTCAITLGLYGWTFQQMSLVSAGFAAILVGLVIDYAMIICREIGVSGQVRRARDRAWKGIIWAAVTTAATFGVLMLSSLPGGQQLGFLVTVGLLVGAFIMLTIFPPLGFTRGDVSPPRAFQAKLPDLKWSKRIMIALVTLVMGGFLITPAPQLSFDLRELEPDASSARDSFLRLQELAPSRGKQTVYLAVDPDTTKDHSRAENKLHTMLEDQFIYDYYFPKNLFPLTDSFRENLKLILPEIAQIRTRALTALDTAGLTDDAADLLNSVLDRWASWESVTAGEAFALAKQSPALRSAVIDADGQRTALGGLRLTEPLDEASHQVLLKLNAPGVSTASWEMLRYDISPIFKADAIRVIVPMTIVLLLAVWAALRNMRDTFTGIAILIVGMSTTVLAVSIALPSWNFLALVGFPLLLGAALDYTLHLTFAVRREKGDTSAVFKGTGLAVVFCAISTIIGFTSLAFASTPAIQDLGKVVSIGIAILAAITVIILPGLLQRKE